MPASFPASMVNQKPADLGIPNRFKVSSSRFRLERDGHDTKEGRCLLDNFEETQRMFLADLDRILDEFEKLKQ
jgi:hypothetical protein